MVKSIMLLHCFKTQDLGEDEEVYLCLTLGETLIKNNVKKSCFLPFSQELYWKFCEES